MGVRFVQQSGVWWLNDTRRSTPIELKDGDGFLTFGTFGIYPPRRMLLSFFYAAVNAIQTNEFGEAGRALGATHFRGLIGDRFFEFTHPRAKYEWIVEARMARQRFMVVRYHNASQLDVHAMEHAARNFEGSKYDHGDNLDHALSRLNRFRGLAIRIFGDRRRKYYNCSSGWAEIYRAGGAKIKKTITISPAWYANTESFNVIYSNV